MDILKSKQKIISFWIGCIEILIGLSALIGCGAVQFLDISGTTPKPYNVFVFVMGSAAISLFLGIGMVSKKEWARHLLVFFSGYIMLTKILIYSGIIYLNGAIVSIVSAGVKDLISFVYHLFLIVFLSRFRLEQKPNV